MRAAIGVPPADLSGLTIGPGCPKNVPTVDELATSDIAPAVLRTLLAPGITSIGACLHPSADGSYQSPVTNKLYIWPADGARNVALGARVLVFAVGPWMSGLQDNAYYDLSESDSLTSSATDPKDFLVGLVPNNLDQAAIVLTPASGSFGDDESFAFPGARFRLTVTAHSNAPGAPQVSTTVEFTTSGATGYTPKVTLSKPSGARMSGTPAVVHVTANRPAVWSGHISDPSGKFSWMYFVNKTSNQAGRPVADSEFRCVGDCDRPTLKGFHSSVADRYTWAHPVAGSYVLCVLVTDKAKSRVQVNRCSAPFIVDHSTKADAAANVAAKVHSKAVAARDRAAKANPCKPPKHGANQAVVQRDLLCLVQYQRHQKGLRPLLVSSELQAGAQAARRQVQAYDAEWQGFHVAPNPASATWAHGYPGRVRAGYVTGYADTPLQTLVTWRSRVGAAYLDPAARTVGLAFIGSKFFPHLYLAVGY
jgi:hypothetical protein